MNLKIAAFRKKYKLTQAELAKHLGVSYQSISKWETQSSLPDIEMLSRMADFFRISLDELVDRKCSDIQNPTDKKGYWGKKLDYLKGTRQDLWNDDYFEFLVQKVWCLSEPIDILDYGCGYGYLGLKLLPLLPEGSTYTGIDVNEELINEAQEMFSSTSFKTEFIIEDIYDFKTKKQYDLAICQAVLRHASDPTEILSNMIDATKSGGKVICIEVNRMNETSGYYNSRMPYDPFIQLDAFKNMWKTEATSHRDYSIGIKVPSMMNRLGLINVDVRMNDRVFNGNDKESVKYLMEMHDWSKASIESKISNIKVHLSNRNVHSNDIEPYALWYKENIEHLTALESSDMVTFYRGLIISYGDKV